MPFQVIELAGIPGGPSPGTLIGQIIEGLALETREPFDMFLSNWTWNYEDVPPEKWAEIFPVIKERITELCEAGTLDYCET